MVDTGVIGPKMPPDVRMELFPPVPSVSTCAKVSGPAAPEASITVNACISGVIPG